MFNTDHAPRHPKGPSRPGTPNNRPRPQLKAEPSLSQSSSSGWGWPRRVSVEVDLEGKRRKDSHDNPREPKAENLVKVGSAKSIVPNESSERVASTQEDKMSVQKRTPELGTQNPGNPLEQEYQDRGSSVSGHHDPSQRQSHGLHSPSFARSDASHRSLGAVTADEYPASESSRSQPASVNQTDTESPNSEKTTQLSHTDSNDQTTEPEGTPREENNQTHSSDQLHRNQPVARNNQVKDLKDQSFKNKNGPPPTDIRTEAKYESDNRSSRFDSKGSKRSSVSISGSKPPGSFPGADSSSEEPSAAREEKHDASQPAIAPQASDDNHERDPAGAEIKTSSNTHSPFKPGSPKEPSSDLKKSSNDQSQKGATAEQNNKSMAEPASTDNESSEPHVKFKGDNAHQHATEPAALPHDTHETTQNHLHNTDPEQISADPTKRTVEEADTPPSAAAPSKPNQIRRSSRDSLRTRSRKPSVYIPLSKVAEAKGKIESANVQPPRSGIIVNGEEALNPENTTESGEKGSDLHEAREDKIEKATFLDYGDLLRDSPTDHKELESKPLVSEDKGTESVPKDVEPVRKVDFADQQASVTPSPKSEVSQEDAMSRRGSVIRKQPTLEGANQRIGIPDDLLGLDSPVKKSNSSRRSTKMSLPPPRIFVQSPSSASELPEPLPTPAVPSHPDEYKVKTRSGTIISVEHTVHGAADKLSQSPPKKRKLYLRKVRNLAARKVFLNATLGRQMGGRTKQRLRQLARGEKIPSSPIPAQENAPDLPPLRKRKSFIRKARNLAARQAFLDATLGRQVAAETKPVLRRMANGEMVVVEEGHSVDVKR
ncbi:hypothetical protein G7Y79_00045g081880 [Physcia stellaris]|nr:hypothetical protein G7Y79_00045g081880 [Physcia stellaris]